MLYRPFLSAVHELLQPSHYCEIGVRLGNSLALARCPAVGIDPAYGITAELSNHVTLFRTTSDEYFSRPDPLAVTGGEPFDFFFIDGLHLFEFAFRDFIHAERHSSRQGVIVFDDVLPRTVDEAARERHTYHWTGDVYPMLEVLGRYRPDLVVLPVGTQPTGLLLVLGLDPDSTVLADHYDEIMAEYRRPDPQPVPSELFDRLTVLPPERVLASGLWSAFGEQNDADDPERFRRQLIEEVRSSLGSAFVESFASSS
ncbi:MAG: class I SAM-dependent methyltransferase [Propionibacteriaceae bacterium]|nr:class I SAM-dependent methyltransferase [Propionibacteriaceae bacterium]